MKNHIIFKFVAVLLCACTLLIAVASAAGIIFMAQAGLYEQAPDELYSDYMLRQRWTLAENVAAKYAAHQNGSSQAFIEYYFTDRAYDAQKNWAQGRWFYTIADETGITLESNYTPQLIGVNATTYEVTPYYPVEIVTQTNYQDYYDAVHGSESDGDVTSPTTATTAPMETVAPTVPDTIAPTQTAAPTVPDTAAPLETVAPTEPVTAPTTAVIDPGMTAEPDDVPNYIWLDDMVWHDPVTGETRYSQAGMLNDRSYVVTLYILDGAYIGVDAQAMELVNLLHSHRYNLLIVLGGSLLLFAIFAVYLCCAAGRKPKSDDVKPGGLNLIPLDLYAVLVGFGCFGLVVLAYYGVSYFYETVPLDLLVAGIAFLGFAACLLIVAFLFAFAAQVKVGGFYWLRHTIVGMLTVLAFKLMAMLFGWIGKCGSWLGEKTPPAAKGAWAKTVSGSKTLWAGACTLGKKSYDVGKSVVVALWGLICTVCATCWKGIKKFCTWAWNGVSRFVALLPLTWQWLLTAFAMCLALILGFSSRSDFWLLVVILGCTMIVLYGANSFGTLLESTRRMSEGDLDTKVDDKTLVGGFKAFAGHLNALAGVAVIAAQKQMKSERMKAELVTNVSHDIKTPLTSIINYVDLLKKAQSQEEAEEYLEVLSRQSLRLKKLIEDLMEMSKASTGNMNVDITTVNAAEAVNQALGEFADKLEKTNLTPVFTPPEVPVQMLADGRLAWRVLSNLLSNAVKYALPGTRLYIDIVKLEGRVLISLKNISREPLNVSSEELMERFVRGDASRNTEGSGLGLNIAKSLMELQHGELQLLVDGDLFKATVIFPEAKQ